MSVNAIARAAVAAASLCLSITSALAGASDYTIEAVAPEIRTGANSAVAIRIRHTTTGKPVEGAIVFRTRLDMAPDDMAAMTAKHAAIPSTEPGVYRFDAEITMAGRWAFRVMAKVQGEIETVQGVVVLQATD